MILLAFPHEEEGEKCSNIKKIKHALISKSRNEIEKIVPSLQEIHDREQRITEGNNQTNLECGIFCKKTGPVSPQS